jgi:hypothetical protein
MTDFTREVGELGIDDLDAVSGGRGMLDIAIDAYENYMKAVGARLMDAIHPKSGGVSLHMR